MKNAHIERKPMVKHLKDAKENWGVHLGEAWRISWLCLLAGGAALIHGLFPSMFQTTASSILRNLVNHLDERSAQARDDN
jgi:hypothetical protein